MIKILVYHLCFNFSFVTKLNFIISNAQNSKGLFYTKLWATVIQRIDFNLFTVIFAFEKILNQISPY